MTFKWWSDYQVFLVFYTWLIDLFEFILYFANFLKIICQLYKNLNKLSVMQKSYGKISNMIQILEELKKKFQKGNKDFMYHKLLCTSQLYKPENKNF